MNKLNRIDKIYIGLVLLVTGALFISSKYVIDQVDPDAVALVFYYDKEIQRISLEDDGFHTVKGDLGDVVIEIKDGSVRVADEISPKNYCQTQGWVSHTNTPIVCLPNGIKIELRNNVYKEEDIIIR